MKPAIILIIVTIFFQISAQAEIFNKKYSDLENLDKNLQTYVANPQKVQLSNFSNEELIKLYFFYDELQVNAQKELGFSSLGLMIVLLPKFIAPWDYFTSSSLKLKKFISNTKIGIVLVVGLNIYQTFNEFDYYSLNIVDIKSEFAYRNLELPKTEYSDSMRARKNKKNSEKLDEFMDDLNIETK